MTTAATPSFTPTQSRPDLVVERGTPTRLLLQRRGPQAARRHLARDLVRLVSLVAVDTTAFLGLRGAVRYLRDDALLGAEMANALQAVFPRGILGAEFVVALVVGGFFVGTYGRGDDRRDPALNAKAVSLAVALACWNALWSQPLSLVLVQGLLMTAVIWCAITLGRLAYDSLIQLIFDIPAGGKPFVFVGDREDPNAQRTHAVLRGNDDARRQTSWVNVQNRGDVGSTESPEKTVQRLHHALSSLNAHTVVLCGNFPRTTLEALVEAADSAGVRVLAAARSSGVMERSTGMVWYNGSPFVELTVPGLKSWQLFLKRAMDFTLAGLGVALLSPLFAIIAVAIKRDSEGPVFFSQERVGYAGEVFRVLKFRTMRTTAEAEKAALAHLNTSGDERLFKIHGDPRVTRVGAFLRRWSLDELPQLFNVVSGEMSLVGPRPFFVSDLESYLDHHFARLGAKPGISGLWQVKGRSDVTDFEEVVRLDREYIERWSLALDLRILCVTLPVVLKGRGAY